MFFDEHKVDREYQNLLLAISKKQQEIFFTRFDWKKKEPTPWPPRGLFGKNKKAIAQYESMVSELEQLKAAAEIHRKKQGYPGGIFWWNVDWEKVQHYLMCDLYEDKGDGVWRFQRDWELKKDRDDFFLFLRENGHCSDFSSNSQTIYAKESNYSQAEQDSMVSAYRKAQKDSNARRIFWSDDSMVYSYKSKTLYASEADYVMSAEHRWDQEHALEKFERSLYTEHITQSVTVTSHSRHYECLFAVGRFHVDLDGLIDFVEPFDYEMCGSRGHITDDIQQAYEEKDAAVALAAYIADYRQAAVIPMQLFGRDITAPAPNFYEAMLQAEIYTCLAQKLRFTD